MNFSERFSAFTVLVANINRCIRKIKAEEMAEFDLKSPHVSCLDYLYTMGPLTAKSLGDVCGEDKAALSRSLERLEAEGYIECTSSAKKRYKSPLALTESGRVVAKQIVEKIDGVLELAGEGMDEAEREVMYRCLAIVNTNLVEICERYENNAD